MNEAEAEAEAGAVTFIQYTEYRKRESDSFRVFTFCHLLSSVVIFIFLNDIRAS